MVGAASASSDSVIAGLQRKLGAANLQLSALQRDASAARSARLRAETLEAELDALRATGAAQEQELRQLRARSAELSAEVKSLRKSQQQRPPAGSPRRRPEPTPPSPIVPSPARPSPRPAPSAAESDLELARAEVQRLTTALDAESGRRRSLQRRLAEANSTARTFTRPSCAADGAPVAERQADDDGGERARRLREFGGRLGRLEQRKEGAEASLRQEISKLRLEGNDLRGQVRVLAQRLLDQNRIVRVCR